MITRRTLFAGLFGLFGVARAKPIAPKEPLPDLIKLGGYKIFWTGWKECAEHFGFSGQWVAFPVDERGLLCRRAKLYYASAPGGSGQVYQGESFDTIRQTQQEFIHALTPPEVKARERGLAFEKLLDVMGKECAL